MVGLTLDTGALIGLERGDVRIVKVIARAKERDVRITVPVAAFAEWWRGPSARALRIRASVTLEEMDERLGRAVGEVLRDVRDATIVDAIVMASAARRGDVVYTSDFGDLERLRSHFPSVRVLSV